MMQIITAYWGNMYDTKWAWPKVLQNQNFDIFMKKSAEICQHSIEIIISLYGKQNI